MTVNDRLALVIGHEVITRVLAQENLAKAQAENADLKARLAEFTNGVEKPKRKAKAAA